VNDSRSELAILLLVLLVVLWDLRPRTPGRRGNVGWTLLGLGGLALVVYQAGQALILEGYLGDSTRQRTEAQLDEAGSVIAGGRPELGAAIALFRHHPWGFGSGTLPNLMDVQVAKTGMAALNYDPENGYVERYMFGTSFELHSVLGDLWTRFGIIGILLTVALLVVLLHGAGSAVADRTVVGLVVYVVVKSLWNLPFSPVFSAVPLLMLAIAMCLVPADRASRRRSPGPTPAPPRTARRHHVRDAH
jgi:O-antigen ligase